MANMGQMSKGMMGKVGKMGSGMTGGMGQMMGGTKYFGVSVFLILPLKFFIDFENVCACSMLQ